MLISITLNNTGNSIIGTFWYSWVPGKDFMSVAPTNVTSPAGWTSNITHGGSSDGYAIQWTAISPADDLVLGNSLSGFSFDSTLSASQLTIDDSPLYPTMPVGTSYTYTGLSFLIRRRFVYSQSCARGIDNRPGGCQRRAFGWRGAVGVAVCNHEYPPKLTESPPFRTVQDNCHRNSRGGRLSDPLFPHVVQH